MLSISDNGSAEIAHSLVVAIGVCHRDVELAANWLRWVEFLARQPGASEMDLLIHYTRRLTADQVAKITPRPVPNIRPTLLRCRDEDESGYPRSASHLFLRTLEAAEKQYPGRAILWCEPDTVAMKPSWHREIDAEYREAGRPFLGLLVGTRKPHLTGIAVYPHDWRQRAPSIASVLQARDVPLYGVGRGQPWDVYCREEILRHSGHSRLMLQIWKERGAAITRRAQIPDRICLFHQDKTGELIREIAAAQYPEFMDHLTSERKFFILNGHPSRLRAKNIAIDFPFRRHNGHSWMSAVCSDQLTEANANTLTLLAGTLGLRSVDEAEYERVTGIKAATIKPRVVKQATRMLVRAPAKVEATHPSVFVMLGRYGDICNILPILKAEADAGRRPTLVVAEEFQSILDGVSYCDRIVWEGRYDRMPDALRWLRRSKGIVAPVVCQVHTHPTDRGRLTPSYQTECWRLAGRLNDFPHRGPLDFDLRDTVREANLVAKFKGKLPLMLIGLESVSSPLGNSMQIKMEMSERFSESHNIVDLSSVRAERIYDLIALFDEAEILLTADTAFLHLARASTVKTIALINSGWRGSVVP